MKRKVAFRSLSAWVWIIGMIWISGCENSDQVGLEITPPGERFQYKIDSTTVVSAITLRQDSLTCERRAVSLLGSMNDPVFGRSKASIMTQLRLSTNEVDFGQNIILDSVQLLLKYKSAYGDTTTLQKVKVYELTNDLFFDSTYYSNLDPSGFFDADLPAGELDFYPTPSADSLVITLNDWIGYKILNADTSNLSENAAFLEFFKGLYITTDPTDGAGSISYFDLSGGNSRMILYYQNEAEDSLSYEVLINTNCTWLNLFSHDYSGSRVEPLINDSTSSSDLVYLQAMSGLRSKLQVNFGDSILQDASSGIAINKAELILPVDISEGVGNYTRPLALRLYGANEDGTNAFIDDIFLGDEYYGGYYSVNRDAYIFNITLHVQNLLHPDPEKLLMNRNLFLTVNDDRVTANRAILQNGITESGMKLVITYTIIK